MDTMKSMRHEMLKEKWRKLITERMQSECPLNPGVKRGKFL